MINNDQQDLDNLTHQFFDLFSNKDGKEPNVKAIEHIFIEQGIIISNTTGVPLIYGLQEFIEPREEMLNDGTLTDFSEYEVSSNTEIFKNIAQRFCIYKKSGKLNGTYFKSEGRKTIQFIKIENVWKMCSVAWSDNE